MPIQHKAPGAHRNFVALYAYDARKEGELSLPVDARIKVDPGTETGGWLHGELNGARGWFPATYAREEVAAPLPLARDQTKQTVIDAIAVQQPAADGVDDAAACHRDGISTTEHVF